MKDLSSRFSRWMQRGRTVAEKPRVRRGAKWFAIGFAVVGVLGFFVAPPVLKSVLVRVLSDQLQREVSVGKIDVNPYALSLRVADVSVREAGGREVAGFDSLYVNLSSSALFRFGVVVDALELDGPRISVIHLGDGRYDVSDLLDKWMAPSEPSPTPRFSLNNLALRRGSLSFEDRPKGQTHTVTGLEIGLPFLSSLPYQTDIVVQPRLAATIDGAPFEFSGKSKPFSANHESEISLAFDRLDLMRLTPYLPANLPVRLQSALAESSLAATFSTPPGETPHLTLSGAVQLSDVRLADAGNKPLLGFKQLDVTLAPSEPLMGKLALASVELARPEVTVQVDRAGRLNWLSLAPPADSKASAKPAPESAPFQWSLGALRVIDGLVHWRDESGGKPLAGDLRDLSFSVGAVDSRLATPIDIAEVAWSIDMGDALRLKQGKVKGVHLDLAGRQVSVEAVEAEGGRMLIRRGRDGSLDWLHGPQLAGSGAAPAKAAPGAPWRASLGRLAVRDVGVRFEDASTTPAAIQTLDGIDITASDLSTENGKKGRLSLASRINQKGSLKADGTLQLSPLAVGLSLETVALPLLPVQPYVADFLSIALTRGQISSKGEFNATFGDAGPVGGYKGSVTVGNLYTVDKVNNADFLKWKSLYVGGMDFRLAPMSLSIQEVALSDFYSRLIVSPAGRLNVMDIVKTAPAAQGETPNKAAVKEAARESGAAAKAPETAGKAPMPISISRITLQGGAINFSDFFVKPNYSVNLTRVGGRVTHLSSAANTVADLELRGNYADTAPVRIVATLNPLAAEAFLDLKADVTGVDLVPLSPYAGKYAGYNIKKGKLSLGVSYVLENRQLKADNRLFIDQLTFGDKVESPTATSLPVNLAISLLKNNRGEIDINLPIAGSLDDPQFSVGGLVLRVIGNLIVKAVTSPFALLGSMFGGGEELSSLDFGPGRGRMDEAALKKLDALAKAMRERQSLKLEITGRVDPEADREGLKRVAVERAVRAEKRKDMTGKGQETESADSLRVTPAEYPAYLQRAYREARFPKPRNLIGLQRDLPVDEMEKLMLANALVTEEDLRQLAIRRAEAVQTWLVETGQVPAERVFLLPPKLDGDKSAGSRVDFSLR